MYFNPLPRKEGDYQFQFLYHLYHWISIHSLVKRETSESNFPKMWLIDFNPLPRKEGDIRRYRAEWRPRNFNPLPRKEGDMQRSQPCKIQCAISIHSLVKRETLFPVTDSAFRHYFNPLPRKEGDAIRFSWFHYITISIHSLVKRETLFHSISLSGFEFQSTPS